MVVVQAMCRDYYTLEFMDRSVDTSPIAPALAAFFDNVLDRSVAQLNFKVRCALVSAAQVCILAVSTGQVSLFKVCISVHQAEQHCAGCQQWQLMLPVTATVDSFLSRKSVLICETLPF